ncbi:IS4 family transposase [Wenzhouxiangella sp. AB-CW3]|uniref:IS4 family transposase n=1 Tax=Wenzhouxiangella sp. AB-CW3 TaxID=2771012 RepID=UPI00168B0EEB|nr:IS4 family transposase [Wenzhouxiangella sp. AB-CW3]QOC23644.1 IS4 family transposase [Wenzhouxiangella sp. AB-CW3]
MYAGKFVFSQLMDLAPWHTFRRLVSKYKGDFNARTFRCRDQFLCMAFAQLTYRRSLRDIEGCLLAQPSKLYHMGIRGRISRSNLADANESRDWRIYAEFAQSLISTARRLYADEDLELDLAGTVYALDSTTIRLCLSLFPWADYRETKAAVKIHTLLDLRGAIPAFMLVSDGLLHDVNILDLFSPERAAFYVMDRAYVDFERLFTINQAGAFFVTRAKKPLKFKSVSSQPVDKSTGLICDQQIRLTVYYSRKAYPKLLRRVRLKDPETGKTLIFLTNNFEITAQTVCDLYRSRWQVELFFKWIKQHLRINQFFGRSENAVKCQIWIAVATYLLVVIARKQFGIPLSLHSMLQILSITPFENIPLNQLLMDPGLAEEDACAAKQLKLL